jgi:hypothetical protein
MKEVSKNTIGGGLDPRVRHKLVCINNECWDMVAREVRTGLLKDTTDYATLNTAMELLESKRTPEEKKNVLRVMLANGSLRPQKAEEINEIFERKLSACMDVRIKKAIKAGELPPPDRNDPMMSRMNKRIKK